MSAADGSTKLRLLTFNAHQGFGARRRRALVPAIRKALRDSGADLVFLQEVGGDAATDAHAAEEHYERLADEMWPQHAYGRNAVTASGHQGNALLSRYPIDAWRNVDVSLACTEPRGLLHCVVDVGRAGHPLHAVCVHLGLRESHRKYQVDRLLALLRDEVPPDAPLVVAGDFNDWRCRVHRRLTSEAGLDEIGARAGGAPVRSFPAWCPLLRLDRIYVRRLRHRMTPLPVRPWSALSDHRPLAGEIVF